MQNGTTTLEGSLAGSYKIKHNLTIQSNNHALLFVPKSVENLWPPKNLDTNIYSNFITVKT